MTATLQSCAHGLLPSAAPLQGNFSAIVPRLIAKGTCRPHNLDPLLPVITISGSAHNWGTYVQIDFGKTAPYLRDPLVLIGFFLFICFLFARFLVKQRVIPPLPPTLGFRALRTILLYGFIIGLLLICLGFALKYKELKDKVLRTVLISDLTPYQQSYAELNRLRDDYDVVASRFQDYLSSLREFLDPVKHSINVESLRKVLAQERFAYALITSFGQAFVRDSRSIHDLRVKLKHSNVQSSGSQPRSAVQSGSAVSLFSSLWQASALRRVVLRVNARQGFSETIRSICKEGGHHGAGTRQAKEW